MPSISRGTCYSMFVYDIAFAIDLNQAEHWISATRESIKPQRRTPRYFEYTPAPLRVVQSTQSIRINDFSSTDAQVQLVLYDFGAVSVTYRVPLNGDIQNLLRLSQDLYENEGLLGDSRD